MDFTTGTPSEEALSQLIEFLIDFLEKEYFEKEGLTAPNAEEAVS